MRKFIYTELWTIPIDKIVFVSVGSEKVTINTDEYKYHITPSSCKNNSIQDEYEDIQRQLAEAEK